MKNDHNFTPEFLNSEIEQIRVCQASGLTLAAALIGYHRATLKLIEQGLITQKQAHAFAVEAAAYAAVVTHYEETGEVGDLTGTPDAADLAKELAEKHAWHDLK